MAMPMNSAFFNAGEQYNTYEDQRYPLGQILQLADGRTYRFARVGSVAAVAGSLYQSEVPGANFDELVVPAAVAVNATTITVTNGATAATENMFAGGYLNVEDDAGEGRAYRIKGNEAADGTDPLVIYLDPEQGIQEALSTASTVGLAKSRFAGVIIHPSPPTAALVGVAAADIPATNYGWFQVRGEASVLTSGTVVIGNVAVASTATDGAVGPFALTEGTPNTGAGQLVVGQVMEVAATTEHSLVLLTLE